MPSSLQLAGRRIRARAAWTFICLTLLLGCDDYTRCEAPDPTRLAALPALLSETGLEEGTPFSPLAALWSDGAEKERFILLPPNTRIDTSDQDDWEFPAGTKLWKTFIRDGVRVETRMLHKLTDGWTAAAYVYLEDGTDAQLTAAGADDALGTEHDVPAASQCPACHRGRESFVLGFSAIQLAHDAESMDELTLTRLIEEGLLTDPPAREPRIPGTPTEREALGYLHANCGHCHNSARPPQGDERCFDPENDLDFWLRVDRLRSVEQTPTYQSGTAHNCIDPGDPHSSQMIRRMSRRGGGQMPPLATELVDERAVALLRGWIDNM